jgi:hypothetical protein
MDEIIDTHYSMAVGLLQIRPHEFWLMEIREFMMIYATWTLHHRHRDRTLLETIRTAGWMSASLLTKKKTKPKDFLKFPYEGGGRKVRPYTQEEKMKHLLAVKPEWRDQLEKYG